MLCMSCTCTGQWAGCGRSELGRHGLQPLVCWGTAGNKMSLPVNLTVCASGCSITSFITCTIEKINVITLLPRKLAVQPLWGWGLLLLLLPSGMYPEATLGPGCWVKKWNQKKYWSHSKDWGRSEWKYFESRAVRRQLSYVLILNCQSCLICLLALCPGSHSCHAGTIVHALGSCDLPK